MYTGWAPPFLFLALLSLGGECVTPSPSPAVLNAQLVASSAAVTSNQALTFTLFASSSSTFSVLFSSFSYGQGAGNTSLVASPGPTIVAAVAVPTGMFFSLSPATAGAYFTVTFTILTGPGTMFPLAVGQSATYFFNVDVVGDFNGSPVPTFVSTPVTVTNTANYVAATLAPPSIATPAPPFVFPTSPGFLAGIISAGASILALSIALPIYCCCCRRKRAVGDKVDDKKRAKKKEGESSSSGDKTPSAKDSNGSAGTTGKDESKTGKSDTKGTGKKSTTKKSSTKKSSSKKSPKKATRAKASLNKGKGKGKGKKSASAGTSSLSGSGSGSGSCSIYDDRKAIVPLDDADPPRKDNYPLSESEQSQGRKSNVRGSPRVDQGDRPESPTPPEAANDGDVISNVDAESETPSPRRGSGVEGRSGSQRSGGKQGRGRKRNPGRRNSRGRNSLSSVVPPRPRLAVEMTGMSEEDEGDIIGSEATFDFLAMGETNTDSSNECLDTVPGEDNEEATIIHGEVPTKDYTATADGRKKKKEEQFKINVNTGTDSFW